MFQLKFQLKIADRVLRDLLFIVMRDDAGMPNTLALGRSHTSVKLHYHDISFLLGSCVGTIFSFHSRLRLLQRVRAVVVSLFTRELLHRRVVLIRA